MDGHTNGPRDLLLIGEYPNLLLTVQSPPTKLFTPDSGVNIMAWQKSPFELSTDVSSTPNELSTFDGGGDFF